MRDLVPTNGKKATPRHRHEYTIKAIAIDYNARGAQVNRPHMQCECGARSWKINPKRKGFTSTP
jgi:hypothetical protein